MNSICGSACDTFVKDYTNKILIDFAKCTSIYASYTFMVVLIILYIPITIFNVKLKQVITIFVALFFGLQTVVDGIATNICEYQFRENTKNNTISSSTHTTSTNTDSTSTNTDSTSSNTVTTYSVYLYLLFVVLLYMIINHLVLLFYVNFSESRKKIRDKSSNKFKSKIRYVISGNNVEQFTELDDAINNLNWEHQDYVKDIKEISKTNISNLFFLFTFFCKFFWYLNLNTCIHHEEDYSSSSSCCTGLIRCFRNVCFHCYYITKTFLCDTYETSLFVHGGEHYMSEFCCWSDNTQKDVEDYVEACQDSLHKFCFPVRNETVQPNLNPVEMPALEATFEIDMDDLEEQVLDI